MTTTSEMTNDELRLAVARVIAKQNNWLVDSSATRRTLNPRDVKTNILLELIPDYPVDSVAALGPIEGKVYHLWSNTVSDESDEIMYGATIFGGTPGGFEATGTISLERAISEACYMAMKGE